MKVYVECKPDYVLVKKVADIPQKKIIHAGNKAEVCKRLKKGSNCIGLVDEDPGSGQPSYLKKMKKERELGDFKVLSDKNGNRLIILCPRLEAWILRCAAEANIDVKKYNLPNNDVKLHGIINANIEKFEKLIDDLLKCEKIKSLKKLLEAKK
jgi:hypothetical protein